MAEVFVIAFLGTLVVLFPLALMGGIIGKVKGSRKAEHDRQELLAAIRESKRG